MAAIVYQTDKRSGITYAYESVSHWDKQKRQSRAKRTLIGRVDTETGKVVPTRNKAAPGKARKTKQGPVKEKDVSRTFFGATYLLDTIGDRTGIASDLKTCFPDTYREILSIAYYLVLEDRNPLSRFPKWAALHRHPSGKDISFHRISELFSSITEQQKHRFFRLQGKRCTEREFWAYATAFVTGPSRFTQQICHDAGKGQYVLPQTNLAFLLGQKSHQPFYYCKLTGDLSDAGAIKNLFTDMDLSGYKKIKPVMGVRFFSEDNVNALCQNDMRFLIAVKLTLEFVRTELDRVRESLCTWPNYCQKHDVYARTAAIGWPCSRQRKNKGSVEERARMYLHLYFDSENAPEEEKEFYALLHMLQSELESGRPEPGHEKLYKKYFDIKPSQACGTAVIPRQAAINEAKKDCGYFALMSNEIKDPGEALDIYRHQELMEKTFDNLAERLDLRHRETSADAGLAGKLFVGFLALCYLFSIKKKIQENHLCKQYTLQELLDELDLIECFGQSGDGLYAGDITRRQMELYDAMGIVPPTAL